MPLVFKQALSIREASIEGSNNELVLTGAQACGKDSSSRNLSQNHI